MQLVFSPRDSHFVNILDDLLGVFLPEMGHQAIPEWFVGDTLKMSTTNLLQLYSNLGTCAWNGR
jgi:hypothetical protein